MIPDNEENVNEIQLFKFNGLDIRAISKDSEPWFIAKDIAEILDYSDAHKMTSKLDVDDVLNLQIGGFGNRGVNIINESGLYSAILRSSKPEAKQFKKWVTSEVLPQIRKTGQYNSQPKLLTEKEMATAYLAKIEAYEKLQKENDVLYIENQTQKQALDYQQPFVEHSQSLCESKSLIATSQLAATQGIEVSAIMLNKFLEKEGVIRKVNSVWIFTSFFLDKGYGKMVAYSYKNSEGEQCTSEQLRWYEKGRAFVIDLWKKRKSEVKK